MQVPRTPVRVVAAPMAGGPSTPELVAAVCNAGGLGFLAGGYLPADELAGQIRQTVALTGHPFGVNIFVPPPADPLARAWQVPALARYTESLRDDAASLRVGLRIPRDDPDEDDTDDWDAKIALVTDQNPVSLVSFTFGCPPPGVVSALHRVGTAVLVTVTERDEGAAAVAVGADALVVQGFEAGGTAAPTGWRPSPTRSTTSSCCRCSPTWKCP